MSVAVVIPCYNEEITIASVIKDYLDYFNQDEIYIIDNNSSDKSIEIAKQFNINILNETTQGKGAVIKNAFNTINTDYILLTDCDSTYSAEDSYILYRYIQDKELDMVIGNRLNSGYFNSKQKLNGFGNRLFSKIASKKKKTYVADLLSGSRVLSKSFYKNVNILHNGFEIETELTLKANTIDFLDISYKSRPDDSKSNLHILKDGIRILLTLLR